MKTYIERILREVSYIENLVRDVKNYNALLENTELPDSTKESLKNDIEFKIVMALDSAHNARLLTQDFKDNI